MSHQECAHLKTIFKSVKFLNSSEDEKSETISAVFKCGVGAPAVYQELFLAALSIYQDKNLSFDERHRRGMSIINLGFFNRSQIKDLEDAARANAFR